MAALAGISESSDDGEETELLSKERKAAGRPRPQLKGITNEKPDQGEVSTQSLQRWL